jgi:hypothetical protein
MTTLQIMLISATAFGCTLAACATVALSAALLAGAIEREDDSPICSTQTHGRKPSIEFGQGQD